MENKEFIFGVATASYQIEGAAYEDGRTPSIWDTFSHTPGLVVNGDTGDVACDHYHRYKEDVQLIADLGVDYYRFSVAWPRIFPRPGEYNPVGMEFYKNLLKELKSKNIKTAVTLYHWDLPQWCQDRGGWPNREVVDWFMEFAVKCFEELGDLADMWYTFNEPMCVAEVGYFHGGHAPGIRDVNQFLPAWHNVALCHGLAVKKYREMGFTAPIGIVMNTQQQTPYNPEDPDDVRAADFGNKAFNGWYLDPVFNGRYPEEGIRAWGAKGGRFDFIQEGDMEIISQPIDFIAINYYQEFYAHYLGEENGVIRYENIQTNGLKTMMNWDITPQGLENVIRQIREYTDLPLLVAENGSAWPDEVAEDGGVHDQNRIDYLNSHLDVVKECNKKGLNVWGYFAWSLMDNFEWAEGYGPRFGLIHVDYKTLKRTPKDSYYVYRDRIAHWNED